MTRTSPRQGVADQLTDRAPAAVQAAAEHILTVSSRLAPIEEGTLVRSGRVEQPETRGDLVACQVGYHTRYAARQHEELGWRHDAGRRARYLAGPLRDEGLAVRRIVAEHLRAGR